MELVPVDVVAETLAWSLGASGNGFEGGEDNVEEPVKDSVLEEFD